MSKISHYQEQPNGRPRLGLALGGGIAPKLSGYSYFRLSRRLELIEQGRQAASGCLPIIEQALQLVP
jgi:hypothetical protein